MKKIMFVLVVFAFVAVAAGKAYAPIVWDDSKAKQSESSSSSSDSSSSSSSSSSNQDTSVVDLSDKSSGKCYSPSLENEE